MYRKDIPSEAMGGKTECLHNGNVEGFKIQEPGFKSGLVGVGQGELREPSTERVQCHECPDLTGDKRDRSSAGKT